MRIINNLEIFSSVGISKICPVCGKTYPLYDYHAHAYRIYKDKQQMPVCSWKCMRNYEKAHQSKREEKNMKKIQNQLNGIKG